MPNTKLWRFTSKACLHFLASHLPPHSKPAAAFFLLCDLCFYPYLFSLWLWSLGLQCNLCDSIGFTRIIQDNLCISRSLTSSPLKSPFYHIKWQIHSFWGLGHGHHWGLLFSLWQLVPRFYNLYWNVEISFLFRSLYCLHFKISLSWAWNAIIIFVSIFHCDI